MIDWTWARYEALGRDDVYDALALRARIFVVEQACAYLDVDGLDRHAWHLLGRGLHGALVAYLRVVDPGFKFDEPSIGRVVVHASMRGTRLGHELLAQGLRRCDLAWPGQPNRIGAQAHLQRFYGRHGYVPVGETYVEDDIVHVDMVRAARDQHVDAEWAANGRHADAGQDADAADTDAGRPEGGPRAGRTEGEP